MVEQLIKIHKGNKIPKLKNKPSNFNGFKGVGLKAKVYQINTIEGERDFSATLQNPACIPPLAYRQFTPINCNF